MPTMASKSDSCAAVDMSGAGTKLGSVAGSADPMASPSLSKMTTTVDVDNKAPSERSYSDVSAEEAAKKKQRKRKIIAWASVAALIVVLAGAAITFAVIYFTQPSSSETGEGPTVNPTIPIIYDVPKSWAIFGNETTGRTVVKLNSKMRWINLAWCPTQTYGGYNMPDSAEGACQRLNMTEEDLKPFDIVNVDLFSSRAADIAKYRKWGKIVSCYFSAGTAEGWREDVTMNPDAWVTVEGNKMRGWRDEKWLDLRYLDTNKYNNGPGIKTMMSYRLAYAVKKGCQLVEPDNVDCWVYSGGKSCYKGIPRYKPNDNKTWGAWQLQLEYLTFLAGQAHARGLGIGLKNNMDQVVADPSVANMFDFAVIEQCFQTGECGKARTFMDADKPVFDHEYMFSSQGYVVADQNGDLNTDQVVQDASPWIVFCIATAKHGVQLQAQSCLADDCASTKYQGPVWTYCDTKLANSTFALTPQ